MHQTWKQALIVEELLHITDKNFQNLKKKIALKLYILDKHEFNLQDKVTRTSNSKDVQAMEIPDFKQVRNLQQRKANKLKVKVKTLPIRQCKYLHT